MIQSRGLAKKFSENHGNPRNLQHRTIIKKKIVKNKTHIHYIEKKKMVKNEKDKTKG